MRRRLAAVGVLAVGATAVYMASAGSITLKPIDHGVFDRQHIASPAYQAVVNGAVIKLNWSDLQATRLGPLDTTMIDQAVVQAHQDHIALKLRIYTGVNSPVWAKNLDGAPVALQDPRTGASIGQVPRFWTANFGAAYNNLMGLLAAKYDNESAIGDVVISRCSTQYAEPYIRQASSDVNRKAYLAAGFSVTKDHQCLTEEIDAAKVWKHTRSSIAFSPYQAIAADGTWKTDEIFTEQSMDYCRTSLGKRCVLGNNSIGWPPDTGAYVAMNAHIKALGPPIYYQTETPDKIGDWQSTLDWAVKQGANMVELNNSYDPGYSLSALAVLDQRLETNPG